MTVKPDNYGDRPPRPARFSVRPSIRPSDQQRFTALPTTSPPDLYAPEQIHHAAVGDVFHQHAPVPQPPMQHPPRQHEQHQFAPPLPALAHFGHGVPYPVGQVQQSAPHQQPMQMPYQSRLPPAHHQNELYTTHAQAPAAMPAIGAYREGPLHPPHRSVQQPGVFYQWPKPADPQHRPFDLGPSSDAPNMSVIPTFLRTSAAAGQNLTISQQGLFGQNIRLRDAVAEFRTSAHGEDAEKREFLSLYLHLLDAYESKAEEIVSYCESTCNSLRSEPIHGLSSAGLLNEVVGECEDPETSALLKQKFVEAMEKLQQSGTLIRPQGNLPKHAAEALTNWAQAHHDHPYPSNEEKEELGKLTGRSKEQITNWFINYRKRSWKPHGGENGKAGLRKRPRKKT